MRLWFYFSFQFFFASFEVATILISDKNERRVINLEILKVIDKVYWFRDVLFKLRGGRSPPSSLNKTVEKVCTLSCL